MTNTPFSKKCEILGQAILDWNGDPLWERLWREYDMGSMFALGSHLGYVVIQESGNKYVEDCWKAFCDTLGVDYLGEFDNLDEMLDLLEYDDE